MSYSILTISKFDKQLKSLTKKYPEFKTDFLKFLEKVSVNPFLGTELGNHCYKNRIAISSKSKGKSGGARIITYVYVIRTEVYLISIYDKSDIENISNKEIFDLLKFIP